MYYLTIQMTMSVPVVVWTLMGYYHVRLFFYVVCAKVPLQHILHFLQLVIPDTQLNVEGFVHCNFFYNF